MKLALLNESFVKFHSNSLQICYKCALKSKQTESFKNFLLQHVLERKKNTNKMEIKSLLNFYLY